MFHEMEIIYKGRKLQSYNVAFKLFGQFYKRLVSSEDVWTAPLILSPPPC